METPPDDLTQSSAVFERVVEEMEWSEVFSTFHSAVKEMLRDATCTQPAPPSVTEVQTENVPEVQNPQMIHLQPVISSSLAVSSPQMPPQTFTAPQADVSKPPNIIYILVTPGGPAESLQLVGQLSGNPLHVNAASRSHSSTLPVNSSLLRNNMQETQQHTVDPSRVFVQRSPNAFAFFAREHRSDVVAGHRVKNSPTVNQILGRKWRAMSMDEQLKYYLMAHSETYTPNCKPPNQPRIATIRSHRANRRAAKRKPAREVRK